MPKGDAIIVPRQDRSRRRGGVDGGRPVLRGVHKSRGAACERPEPPGTRKRAVRRARGVGRSPTSGGLWLCCWFVPALRLCPGAQRPFAEQKSRLGERSEP